MDLSVSHDVTTNTTKDDGYQQADSLAPAHAPEAIPLFFDSASLSSSNTSEPYMFKRPKSRNYSEEPVKTADALLLVDRSSSISMDGIASSPLVRLKRGRRQAPEHSGEELPSWPGMPRGVLRNFQEPSKKNIPNTRAIKTKIMDMMLQSVYSAQERLWPLEALVKKYHHLTPYRMAFIYMKLDQLVHEAHSILRYLQRQAVVLSMTRRLQMYSHLMRRNIDITYLVDYISGRVPYDQEVRVRQYAVRKDQEQYLQRWQEYDRTTTTKPGRWKRPCDNYMNNC